MSTTESQQLDGFTHSKHICWLSKQNIVSHSMMEAEVIAGSFSSVEGTWLSKLGKDFNLILQMTLRVSPNSRWSIAECAQPGGGIITEVIPQRSSSTLPLSSPLWA